MKKFTVLTLVLIGFSLVTFYIFIMRANDADVFAFDLYEVDLTTQSLEMLLVDEAGERIGTFDRLNDVTDEAGRMMVFATNGGMFHDDWSPVGLFISEGEVIEGVNIDEADGNFFLKPNGIFYIDDEGAHVVTTDAYLSSNPSPTFATQSGPMLLVGGEYHDEFRHQSDSTYIRNGVCVRAPTDVVFVISRDEVYFYSFANIFLQLGCKDALYLDGYISKMYAPEIGLHSLDGDFGPLIVVTE